jgi:hypothetical protein
MMGLSNVYAVRAEIETRIGKMCCEDCSGTDLAFSATYVTAGRVSDSKWAQTGYVKHRNAGSSTSFVKHMQRCRETII